MERLTVYQTDKGRYSVRPIDWEGILDKQGRIQENGLNHTGIFAEKEDAEFFAKAKNAEEQGKLLILPCKPGDTVWDNDFGTPTTYEITGFSFGDLNDDYLEDEEMALDQTIFHYSNSSGSITGIFAESEIGKTVFLTEQEAKEALDGMKE